MDSEACTLLSLHAHERSVLLEQCTLASLEEHSSADLFVTRRYTVGLCAMCYASDAQNTGDREMKPANPPQVA